MRVRKKVTNVKLGRDKKHSRAARCCNHYREVNISQLALYSEIMAVCSQIHTKHINTLCGHYLELLYVRLAAHKETTVRYI